MNSKSRFTLGIIVLTVLLIGFFTVALMMGMFLSIKGFAPERLGFLIISVGLGFVTLRKMISLNKKETRSRVDAVVKDHHEFITEWVIAPSQWKTFVTEKLAFDLKESNGYGYTLGGILGVISGFVFSNEYAIEMALLIGAVAFLFFFFVGKYGALVVAKKKFGKLEKLEQGEVHFAKEVIIFNEKLIIVSGFGQTLRSFAKEDRFGMNLLTFTVQTGFGHRRNTSQFMIPIPLGGQDEADKLLNYYASLIPNQI